MIYSNRTTTTSIYILCNVPVITTNILTRLGISLQCIELIISRVAISYCIRGTFGGDFNSAVWRI